MGKKRFIKKRYYFRLITNFKKGKIRKSFFFFFSYSKGPPGTPFKTFTTPSQPISRIVSSAKALEVNNKTAIIIIVDFLKFLHFFFPKIASNLKNSNKMFLFFQLILIFCFIIEFSKCHVCLITPSQAGGDGDLNKSGDEKCNIREPCIGKDLGKSHHEIEAQTNVIKKKTPQREREN